MGVDNNALLVVGLEENQFPWHLVNTEEYEGSVEEWYWAERENLDIPPGLEFRNVRNEYWKQGIVGFVVADSGSYSYKEIVEPKTQLQKAQATFQRLFKARAKVFIANRQW